jgi:hypothetical protein
MSCNANCVICGKPFEAKRKSAKYCSITCRSKSFRGISPLPNQESATLTPEDATLTEKEENPATLIKGPTIIEEEDFEEEEEVKVKVQRPGVDEAIKRGFEPFDMCPKHNVFYSSCIHSH